MVRLTHLPEVGRVGKKRLMLVVMRSETATDMVLDKSRIFSSDGHLSIKLDLTDLKREEDKGVRDEIDSLNQTNPIDDGVPYHWKPAGRMGFLRMIKEKGEVKASMWNWAKWQQDRRDAGWPGVFCLHTVMLIN